MDRRIASLLNSCKSGNLPAVDQQELNSLIADYFVPNGVDSEWSDDDFSSESDTDPTETNESDSDEDAPLVHVEDVRQEGCFANNMDVDAAPNDGGMLAQARQRSCKANGNGCKQIKVSGPSPGDTRRGCITQFSPEEIVALKLSVLDMDRGELILIYFYVFTSIHFLHCN